MNLPPVPAVTESAIRAQFGDAGQGWLRGLDALLAKYAERWSLDFEEPYTGGLAINLVCRVTRRDQDSPQALVLKTGYPEPELFTELTVLKHWRGRDGCVQLIEFDETEGVMLLQRIVPGVEFRTSFEGLVRSRQAIDLFERVPVTLKAGEQIDVPSYQDWMTNAFGTWRQSGDSTMRFQGFLEQAEDLFLNLSARHTDTALLHGDLHHENILSNGTDSWIAIDPKGVTGPRILECGRYMHNFIEDEAPASTWAVLETRAQNLSAALGFDERDILATGFLDLVLSVCWTLNSRTGISERVWQTLRDYSALKMG